MGRFRKSCQLLKQFGLGWALFRVGYALRKRTGLLIRSSPSGRWNELGVPPAIGAPPALFARGPLPGPGCLAEADDILLGYFRLFSFARVNAGFPPDWHSNPLTGERAPSGIHWSRVSDFAHGDIKCIWELSRFSWAVVLGRAFARTRDPRYGEAFWVLFDDWMERNPPNQGPNWMCGQEATFRMMAATFARLATADAPAATPERLARFGAFVQATGRRIEANLAYALSQSNNHGISECVGLITAAHLLPGLKEASRWHRRGLRSLQGELSKLVYADGAFAQHSANYHRLLLHDLLWCVAIVRAGCIVVPQWLIESGQRALAFIDTLMNPATGRTPLYGANDGANILQLADADYLDFRPLVQAGFAVFHGERRLPPGPWDEAALWLAGLAGLPEDKTVGVAPERWQAVEGGCFQWKKEEMRLFLRCPTRFRHRPSQADLLHVDIDWQDQPIAIDAGTYSYNTAGKFKGALGEAAVHNTLTIDGVEPMEKASRFLYLPWPRGSAEWRDQGERFEATHTGWQRLRLEHIRSLRFRETDGISVEDVVRGKGDHILRVHWLLADWPYELQERESRLILRTTLGKIAVSWQAGDGAKVTLVRADPESARGWRSPHYLQAEPALSLGIEVPFHSEIRIETRFTPVAER